MAFIPIMVRGQMGPGTLTSPSVVSTGRRAGIRVTPSGAWIEDTSALITISVEQSSDNGATWRTVGSINTHAGATATRNGVTHRPSINVSTVQGTMVRAVLALGKRMAIGLDVEV